MAKRTPGAPPAKSRNGTRPKDLEVVPIVMLEKLRAPYNPRKEMDGHEFDALRASIRDLGVLDPVVVNRRTQAKGWPEGSAQIIVGGHQRIRAAAAEGLSEFPVYLVDLTKADEKRANLALNQIRGRWDDDALASMLRELRDSGADLLATGFDDAELKRRMQIISSGFSDPDRPAERVSRRVSKGDTWKLGEHFLVCGDSTDPAVQAALFARTDKPPVLCVTDPPYGVEYDPGWRNEAAAKGQLSYAARRTGVVQNDDRADWTPVWQAMPCEVVYAWCAAGDLMIEAGRSLQGAGFEIRASIVWAKSNFPISRGHYTFTHEPCWYAVRKGATAHWIGDNRQATVWEATLDKNVPGDHSTQKPVALFTHAIGNHDGDVFEPFAGSGTCVIACEQLARRCFAIELDEHYCDAIVARWEAFTGRKAERVAGGGATRKRRRAKAEVE